ncbi:DNA (cytosine-5)-methyltransferase 1 [Arthrobacter sp. SORGH_AS 212]|nr:DNA (cytosine-5)-methyltransferase 1 [Arthrobacter sp. SORGH_AS_0212]
MTALRAGELCAGYGGLALAIEEVFEAETAWVSEFDAAPSKILAHHWPHVPNYGDMTKIDWAAIEPVDIISGGTPCQDLSAAGRRAGMTEGTRSNLWVQMREAIAIQRPRYVVWENVRGAYSATAASDLEQCPGCMGDTGDGGTVLRALGRVLGDLSDLGYDAQWRGLRAADVGACHARFRVFVLAVRRPGLRSVADPHGGRGREGQYGNQRGATDRSRAATIPNSSDRGHDATADAMRGGNGGRTSGPGASRRHYAVIGSGTRGSWARLAAANAGSATLREHAQGPFAKEARASSRNRSGDYRGKRSVGDRRTTPIEWGPYAPAILRWEAVRGTAPSPTELTAKGSYRLSARFAEWMMGLPEGWVTDPAIGISRNEQLKACGNGVVPQQAIAALRDMLAAYQTVRHAA